MYNSRKHLHSERGIYMPRKLKIAQGQFALINNDTEQNFNLMKKFIEEAGAKECDLITLPECAYTGYSLTALELQKLAETKNDFFVSEMKKLAKENKIHIYAGYPELDEIVAGRIYNSAIFIDDEGNILANMRKVYLWGDEKLKYRAGEKYPVVSTKFGKVGLQICYDMELPEPSRIQALKGAEIILNVSYWSMPARTRWFIDMRGNALFNVLFMSGTNAVKDNLCGSSMIVGPDGEIINRASETEQELLITEIDLDYVVEMRSKLPYLNDFKEDTFTMEALNKY
ncbi:amidohydrolase [Peptoniphilus indolicus ATCC 29427]|uniref:Amidohydrolase n=2 Tax=Peptoniphilus indolicus TaxID=33030 RepID=G4D4Q7_9FIRM|nr:amidohydrolase [Peptoniphilus indolicus ATCC 29427]